MKKILCIVLSIIMILPTAAYAAVSGEVEYSENTKNIYIKHIYIIMYHDAGLVHGNSNYNNDCTRIIYIWITRILGYTKNRNARSKSTLFNGQN